jgi:energy-coupling factor transporter ATP-binding protein EcfA2
MKPGAVTAEQLARLDSVWHQGEHVLITGGTGSGKTALARHIVQKRLDRGGHVVVLAAKPKADETLTTDYRGWTRWKEWKKRPPSWENRILLWPDTDKLSGKALLDHQRDVFSVAFDYFERHGMYTVQIDEGLYTCNPTFLNMSDRVAMLHAMGRSAKLTVVTCAQRPAHLPLIVYSSAAHVMAGRMRERADYARLSELGGKQSARELAEVISRQGRHDFLWLPIAPDFDPEPVNLKR